MKKKHTKKGGKKDKSHIALFCCPIDKKTQLHKIIILIIIVYILKRSHTYIFQVVFLLSESCLCALRIFLLLDKVGLAVLPPDAVDGDVRRDALEAIGHYFKRESAHVRGESADESVAAGEEFDVRGSFHAYASRIAVAGAESSLDESRLELFFVLLAMVELLCIFTPGFAPRFRMVPRSLDGSVHQREFVLLAIRFGLFYGRFVVGGQENVSERVGILVSQLLNALGVLCEICTSRFLNPFFGRARVAFANVNRNNAMPTVFVVVVVIVGSVRPIHVLF